jgi:ABC-type multidrug transport system fused ATPase/permease subunit
LPIPLISRYIIDIIIPGKQAPMLLFCVILVLVVLVVLRAIVFFQGLLFYKINQKVIFDIKLGLLNKINRISLGKQKEFGTGYLMGRINEDVQGLQTLFADTIVSIIKDILFLLTGLAAVFIIHWKLALATVCIIPFFVKASLNYGQKVRKLSGIFFECQARTNRKLEELLNMGELTKIFGRYKFNLLRYFQEAKAAFRANIGMMKISFLNSMV